MITTKSRKRLTSEFWQLKEYMNECFDIIILRIIVYKVNEWTSKTGKK